MAISTHTQRTRHRYFYARKNQNAIQECLASKSIVATLYKEFKNFDHIIPGKTYAQALLSNVKANHKHFEISSHGQVVCTPKIHSGIVLNKNHSKKIPQEKVTCPRAKNVHYNNSRVTLYSVAGAPTIAQRQQDQLVLSNRFQMLQCLTDKQEQDQQTPQVSLGSVSLPIGTRTVQKKKCCKNVSPHVSKATVDDKEEVTLAQQEKIPLVGNKKRNWDF